VIPIKLVNEPYLSGKKLVKAVRADQCTVDSSRGLYARVCVEVDFKLKKSSQFCLNDDIQRVEYGSLLLFHLELPVLSFPVNGQLFLA
jgi:hypothetical protein